MDFFSAYGFIFTCMPISASNAYWFTADDLATLYGFLFYGGYLVYSFAIIIIISYTICIQYSHYSIPLDSFL